MNGSLINHGALSERSRTDSLSAPIGKGREGKGVRKGREVGHLAYPTSSGAHTPGARIPRPRRSAMQSASDKCPDCQSLLSWWFRCLQCGWEGDHTALVHVLWSAKHRGLTIANDADALASMVRRSRWMAAVTHTANDGGRTVCDAHKETPFGWRSPKHPTPTGECPGFGGPHA